MRRRFFLPLGLALAALPATAAGAAGQIGLADYDYENLGFRALGIDAGYLWSDKIRDTEIYSIRLDLGYLGPGVRIIPSISYWDSEFAQSELDDLARSMGAGFIDGPIRWSDISLSVDGHFVWNTPLRVLTFVGAGFGLHALNGQGEAIDDTFVEDLLDAITAGVSAIAGFEFQPLPRLRVYAEGRYTAMNSVQFTTARGGLQFMFSQGDGVTVGAVPAPREVAP